MRELSYNRHAAVAYAVKWALGRNPAYYNFENIGGDCTNFTSQCIYAGAQVMNFTPVTGWFYKSSFDRSASWSGVEYLYKYLINKRGVGPYAREVPQSEAELGDIVQLGRQSGDFYHSLVITAKDPYIFVSTHTYDALNRPLSSYSYDIARFLHIEGVHA